MLSSVVLLVFFASPCISWTTSAYMNLVSPPRLTTGIGDAYMVKDGIIQPGSANHLGSCLNKPTPANVTRTPFPITGGELRFEFVNNSAGPPDEKFSIDMYFTDDNADYSSNGFFRWGGLKRMQYWENFETGWSCSVPMDMTDRLRQPGNATAVTMLDGLNVTFALLIGDLRNGSDGWGGNLFEEVDQCAYVTLTSDSLNPRDGNTEMCNAVNLDYFASSTSTTSVLPTATSSAAAERRFHTGMPPGLPVCVTFILVALGL